ncbi:uncharacterized protein BDZ99DRAFT_338250, partial [Mytilinidion resinicola]
PWMQLIRFLNNLIRLPGAESSNWTSEFPHERRDGSEHCPEDFLSRGQIWSHSYWPADWFDDVRSNLDPELSCAARLKKIRIQRILWLGVKIARVSP